MLLQPRLATLTYAAPHLIVSQSMTYAMQLFDPRPVAKDLALRRTAISMSLEPTPVDAPRKPRAGEPNMVVAEETEVAVAGAAAVTTEENKLFYTENTWTATPADGHPEAVPCDATVSDAKLTTRTYSDGAKTLLEWTRCDAAGKTRAEQAVDSMRPERSTNLMAGLVSGFDMMKKVPGSNDDLQALSLNLIVCTDGMPSPQAAALSPLPCPGPRLVARAWTDPEFKEHLLRDAAGAARQPQPPPRASPTGAAATPRERPQQ